MDDDFERECKLASERQKKKRKFDTKGLHDHVCVLCGEDEVLCPDH